MAVRTTQLPVEVLYAVSPTVRVTQLCVEILHPFACPTTPVPAVARELVMRRQRTMPHFTDEQVWIFYHRAHLDVETGTANLTGDGTDPQIMLDWSDDGGHTWSQEKWRTAGRTADWTLRALWRRLGRSRDRIFRVTVTAPVKWSFIDFYLQVTRGTH